MAVCASCGQNPGDGRFCVRCGYAVAGGSDPMTDTAERPAVTTSRPPRQPPPPPHPGAAPSNARFPMYADEVVDRPPAPPPTGPSPTGPPPYDPLPGLVPGMTAGPVPPAMPPVPRPPRRSGFVPMVIAGISVLLLLVLVAAWLVLRPASTDGTPSDSPGSKDGSSSQSGGATDESGAADGAGDPEDVTAQATVEAPEVAPPNQDVNGKTVTYDPGNMLDGDSQTAWRMPGDGTDAELTIDLGSATTVTEVGLVNGYAKVDRDSAGREVRWYPRNRRLLEVAWVFDDGTTVTQSLDQTPRLQTVEVPDVTTTSITLRLVSVSPPLPGPQGRDYTAISDLSLVGTPSP